MQIRLSLLSTGITLALLMALTLSVTARADDKNAAGTWTWNTPARGGGADRTNTLKLKIEGAKLTGKLSVPGRDGQPVETEISDGKVSGDEVSFTVNREIAGTKVV